MSNKIQFTTEQLKKGIDIACDAVAPTLGAAGRNSIYRSFYSRNPIGTNDGISILKEINLEDEALQMGVDMVKQSSSRTNDEVGDGTTSAVLLAKSMVDKGLKVIKSTWFKRGVSPMILKGQIKDAVNELVQKIKDKAKKIDTDEDMFHIANLSMENEEIAKLVVSAVKKAGENGTVLVEESTGMEIKKEEVEGLKFEKGYIAPFMVTNPLTMEATLNNVSILITDKSLNMNQDLFPLIEELNKQGEKQILIICEGMQGELLTSIFANRQRGTFHAVVVQKPADSEILDDIAILTGGEALTASNTSGYFNASHVKQLGKASKVIITKDSTLIIGGAGDKKKISERVFSLKADILVATGYKKEMLKERLAKLVGGVVIIKVGAPTEAEMKYLKLKIDDAVAATRAAVEEGIIMGGGKTLYEFSQAKPKNAGEEVVFYACQQPIKQIIKNAGFNPRKEIKKLGKGEVWDALKCAVCKDPYKEGLVDPAKVERCCLENAASFAGLFLSCFCVLVDNPQVSIKE